MSNGIPVTLARATEELRKYRHGLKAMSGGFTLSGGEALMQDRFAVKLFAAAQAHGDPHRARHQRLLRRRASATPSWTRSTSCCSTSRAGIRSATAASRAWTSARRSTFARRLAARGRPVWVRFVLVPGLTDDPEDVEAIAGFAAGLGNVQRVDVLPFHQMGRFKWKELGLEYKLDDVEPPSPEAVERPVRRVPGGGAHGTLRPRPSTAGAASAGSRGRGARRRCWRCRPSSPPLPPPGPLAARLRHHAGARRTR